MSQENPPAQPGTEPIGEANEAADSAPKRRGRQGIPREAVQAAMDTLRSQLGREATLAELRAETGTGSMTTLTRHRRAVLDERLMQSATPIPKSTEASLLKAVSSVHEALSREIAEAADVHLASEVDRVERDAWDRITRIDQERLLAEQQRDEGLHELIGARATIKALEARVASAEATQHRAQPLISGQQTGAASGANPHAERDADPSTREQLTACEQARDAALARVAQLEKAELVLQTRLESAHVALAASETRLQVTSNDLTLAFASLKNRGEDQAQVLLAQSQTLAEHLQKALETLSANAVRGRDNPGR